MLLGVVTIVVANAGGIAARRVWGFARPRILPGDDGEKPLRNYKHLAGEWHLYFVTKFARLGPDPFWVHGVQKLEIKRKKYVRGTTTLNSHPSGQKLDYEVQGQIRAGRVILTDKCLEDETEFASVILPNLASDDLLVGIWTGLDNDRHLISAPVVLSRKPLDATRLCEIASSAPQSLVGTAVASSLYQPAQGPSVEQEIASQSSIPDTDSPTGA